MEFITKNAEETKKLGREMAVDLTRNKESGIRNQGARILALTGDLGSGKTTFVQGLAEGMGVSKQIISPTFIILRKYLIPNTRYQIQNFYHLDLYRLEENIEQEVKNLGIEELWKDPKNIVVIEWAEKILDILPKDCTKIKFEVLNESGRKITIEN